MDNLKTARNIPDLAPSLDEFINFSKNYKIIPLSIKLPADIVTPISLFQRFQAASHRFLLESVEGGERWSRYSIMGRNPIFRVICQNSQIRVISKNGEIQELADDNPVDSIRRILNENKIPPELSSSGFRCGLTGYFSYDFIRYLEKLPDNNPDELNLPDCDLIAPEQVIVYDHLKHEMTLIFNIYLENKDAVLLQENSLKNIYFSASQKLIDIIEELNSITIDNPYTANSETEKQFGQDDFSFTSNISKTDYINQVLAAKKYIKQGDIFQVVLSQRFSSPFYNNPLSVYRALRSVNPSPYLFYLQQPETILVGASPEMLVKLSGDKIETCPIAGTRKRGKDHIEDEKMASDLLADTKELAEHAMLVDLARNDVGKISKFGSVKVKEYAHIEKFSHVMHLVSLVEGTIASDKSAIDVLCSLLPAGTLSGAPKIRAMEIIDELETKKRGAYGGAVGYLGFDGQMDTCITIRTALIKDNKIHIQAGAGIVADSDPESEYNESVNKAMALMTSIRQAGVFK